MWSDEYEIWLNADIYAGPVNATNTPVDADSFLQEAKKFDKATLSIGWTTQWSQDSNDGKYDREQITTMIEGLNKTEIKNPITFPIRAGIGANSLEELSFLYDSLKDTNHVTFTIWSGTNDYVDIGRLRNLIFYFGIDKVYIDVPDTLFNQLDLSNNPYDDVNGATVVSKLPLVQILMLVTILIFMF